VLIIGCGSSGCQIAEELHECGREVYLSVRSHRLAPRRYHGRDLFWWLGALGKFDATIDSQPERRIPSPLLLTGAKGGHDVNLREFRERGIHLLGSFVGIEGSTLHFGADLEANLAKADATLAEFKQLADAYLRSLGERAHAEDNTGEPSHIGQDYEPIALNLGSTPISAVIWCTGYRGDFGWVQLPIFNALGNPVQRRGVTDCPGAYFLGLHWMHTMKSSTLFGVGEDAAYLATQIVHA